MTPPVPAAIDPEAVRAIVVEVLRRIGRAGLQPAGGGVGADHRGAGLQPAGVGVGHRGSAIPGTDSGRLLVRPTVEGGNTQDHGGVRSRSSEGGVALAGRVISLAMLEKLPAGVTRVTVEAAAVITPSAREHARDKGIAIERAATAGGQPAAARPPFLVAHAECGSDAASRAAGVARAVPGAAQLPASGIADVVAALAVQASRDAARGVLLTGKPALAVVLANRSASLRAVTARDPATLAAAAAECNANLLVVDPASFPAAALLRLAAGLATKPAGETPAPLAARPAGCGCKGH